MNKIKIYFKYNWETWLWNFCLMSLTSMAILFFAWLILGTVFLLDPGNYHNNFEPTGVFDK